jgi:hypothetical protein
MNTLSEWIQHKPISDVLSGVVLEIRSRIISIRNASQLLLHYSSKKTDSYTDMLCSIIDACNAMYQKSTELLSLRTLFKTPCLFSGNGSGEHVLNMIDDFALALRSGYQQTLYRFMIYSMRL